MLGGTSMSNCVSILVVSEAESYRDRTLDLASIQGWRIRPAENYAQALAQLADGQFDVVLIDSIHSQINQFLDLIHIQEDQVFLAVGPDALDEGLAELYRYCLRIEQSERVLH